MLKLSSRSATVLVIFVVACVAFCLASVFASMTGPISILPNESESGSVLDNLSVIENADTNNYQSSSHDYSNDYSSSQDDSQSDESQVETTTDNSHSTQDSQVETTEYDSSQQGGQSNQNPSDGDESKTDD